MADSTVTQQVGFAPQVAPYAETLLGSAQNLTQKPWEQYGGERQAQFSPLQQQSYGTAGQQGFTNYTPAIQSFAQPGMAGQYMSPYMQNVVDIQKREAARQSDIMGQQQQAQAAQAGAFGGSRDAIMRAERERNLGQQMGDIQAQGLQSAYQQAQNQFNTENQLREQANQYGRGYGLSALTLQNQLGGQQQQQAQNILSNTYQDWLDKQNYPYKNLSFMSDIIRGAPTTTLGKSMYEASPSMLNQAIGLGTALFGGSKLPGKAEGGTVGNPSGLAALIYNGIK